MDKEDILLYTLMCFMAVLIGLVLFAYGYCLGREGITNRLCNDTAGKYDFCIEKKTWEIK